MPDVLSMLAVTRLAGEPGRGDLLILGSGLGTTCRTLWGPVVEQLGDGFDIVGVDLPGHGSTPPAEVPFTVADLATRIRALALESGAGPERASWYAGVSLAGAVSLALAVDPGPLRGVAAVAAASTLGEPPMWRERAALVRASGAHVMVSGSLERWFAPEFVDRDQPTVDRMMDELSDTDDESYALACEALAGLDLRAAIPHPRVPVLLVAGEVDAIVSEARIAEDHAAIPGSTLITLLGVGHEPPVEAPEMMARALTEFVTSAST
jgi:pimeloyl-ACP methyl ester carboxylesterase